MIQCENITKVYSNDAGDNTVLKGVSLTIEEGEFVAIMGPSGSGKSTMMHILGALDTATSGKYYLDGRDVTELSDDELSDIRKEKIGFVFQSFNLLPRTTALRNVVLPLIYLGLPHEEREKRAKMALRAAGLPETHDLYKPNQLSGGQIQRVAIARALVNDPKLILADEPTGNLDTKTSEVVLGTFQRLNREHGRTIILITHERDIAEHADRVIFIRDGQIIEDTRTHDRRKADEHIERV